MATQQLPSHSSKEEEADRGSFETLPEELLVYVLSYLPFPHAIRARLVCRSWLSALTSPAFFLLWSRRSSPSFWLLIHQCSSPSLYALQPLSRLCLPLPSISGSHTLVGSSHGVLCLRSPSSLFLLNPLSRVSLPIPLPNSSLPFFQFGFVFHPPPLNRFLIIACDLSYYRPSAHFEIYDSTPRSWAPLPPPPPPPLAPFKVTGSMLQFVWWNGKFCVLCAGGRMITYDLHASQWGTVHPPTYPRLWNSRFMTLHVIRGRLLLEGNDIQRRYRLTVGIVELNPTTLHWKGLASMPEGLAQMLCPGAPPAHSIYASFSDADCDYICFCPVPSTCGSHIVFYHLGDDSWTSMQVDVHFDFGSSSFRRQWAFQPNFAALL